MAVQIGPRIGIDGEDEYRKTIMQLIQQGKTLDAQMRAVGDSFATEAEAQEAAAKKSELLTKRIEAQREQVQLLADMVEKAASATDEDSSQTLKWEEALANATAQLHKLEAGAQDSGDAVEAMGQDMAGASGNALTLGDMIRANVTSEAIIGGFEALAAAAVKVGKALLSTVRESAAFADEVLTLSTNTGLSTDTIQEFQYMAELTDTSVETITGSLINLTKQMDSARSYSNSTADIFAALGVSVLDANENFRDSTAVFYETVNALRAIPNTTERDILSIELLGNSFRELENAINQQGEKGPDAIASQVKAVTKAMDKARTTTNSAGAAFQALGVNVVDPLTGQLRDNETVFYEVIDALGKIPNETERDAASMAIFGKSAQDLNSLIATGSAGIAAFAQEAREMGYVLDSEALSSLGAADDGFQRMQLAAEAAKNQLGLALAPVVTTVSERLVELSQAVDWTAFREMLTGGEIAAIITTISSMIIDELPTIIECGTQLLFALVDGFTESLPNILPTIVNAVLTIAEMLTGPDTILQIIQAAFQIVSALADGLIIAIPDLIQKVPLIMANLLTTIYEFLPTLILCGAQLIGELGLGILQGIVDAVNAMAEVFASIGEIVDEHVTMAQNWGRDLVQNFINGIFAKAAALWNAVKSLAAVIASYLHFSVPEKGPLSDLDQSPKDMVEMYAKGLDANAWRLEDAVAGLATDMSAELVAPPAPAPGGSYNYGGFVINIYGAEGQDEESLADAVMDRIQYAIDAKEAVFA